ncbi:MULTISPECIES: hypothetical protein [unclassified Streptomyces]|uniref:hypothetical protein n=1 Tax=unclassified Streptomyces TaxID=2593676 RepID=UPI000AB52D42|nr:hypothetical protein [Streptomyces sp. TSRI0107]
MTLTMPRRPEPFTGRAARSLHQAARLSGSLLSALAVAALYWVVLTRGGAL